MLPWLDGEASLRRTHLAWTRSPFTLHKLLLHRRRVNRNTFIRSRFLAYASTSRLSEVLCRPIHGLLSLS